MSATVRPASATSADHRNARAPAVASATSTERPSPSRAASSRYLSLSSASARTPPSRAPVAATVLAIELLHRATEPVAKRDLHRLGGPRDLSVGDVALLGGERREHVLREIAD